MEIEAITLSKQISDKLNIYFNGNDDYQVFVSNDTIVIKVKATVLAGTYDYPIPGEINLSVEDTKKFLDILDKVIIINDYLNKDDISFRNTKGNRLVFSMDGKEISNNEIITLYNHLEMKKEKSPLPLELNMIKAKSLYERYTDLYEQVAAKHQFLESYNELIISHKGKKEAIEFALRNVGTWGRIREQAPSRIFDITGNEDLVDTIINGEKVSFDYGSIPLEKKKIYLMNLDNYELRINNLIERLEKEIKKLEKYNEQVSTILESISKCNSFNIKPISSFPIYDCMNLDDILIEEKQKYKNDLYRKIIIQPKAPDPIPVTEKYPWLEDVDTQQRKLGTDKKTALMLYKSSMYHLFNNIISYARNNNLKLDELYVNENGKLNDKYIEHFIKVEYQKYVEKVSDTNKIILPNRSNDLTVVDELFPDNYLRDYKSFRDIALNNVKLLESSLSETILNQPLTVYRCVYEPKDSDIYSGNLGNALLSTTTNVESVSQILHERKMDIEYESKKVIYKIELPAGSPIIAFTKDIYLKDGSESVGFSDDQKEILIDSNNYDFECVGGDFNQLEDGTDLYLISLNAMPKMKTVKNR